MAEDSDAPLSMVAKVVRCDAQGVTSVRRLHAKIVINRFPGAHTNS